VRVIEQWTGREADALRRALRMTADEFAVRVKSHPRTVNYWRERPSSTPQAATQRALDSLLDGASDRAKAQFAQFVGEDSSMNDATMAERPEPLAATLDAHGPNPDEQARMRSVLRAPSHLDAATVTYLTQGLYGQRHANDSLGAGIMIAAMSAQLETLKELLRRTSGPNKPSLLHLIADWTTFVAWLHTELGEYAEADSIFTEAEEMADELGDGVLGSTATSYRGYLALLQGNYRAAVRNTAAALATPGAHPTQLAYDSLQEAQGYAGLGDLKTAEQLLHRASDLITGAGDPPESLYWYTEPFLLMNIGLTQHAIGQHRYAADSLASGIAGLPADQQGAEWMGEYRQALDRARAEVDEPTSEAE
jgi:tetratricopeptide (TPR) repeat protein